MMKDLIMVVYQPGVVLHPARHSRRYVTYINNTHHSLSLSHIPVYYCILLSRRPTVIASNIQKFLLHTCTIYRLVF